MAYIGVSPSNGVRQKHTYTATANQTSFSGVGAENVTLSYRDSNYVDVYRNGVKLGDEDYTSTSGTAIVLAEGAAVNDIVEIIVYDVFSIADLNASNLNSGTVPLARLGSGTKNTTTFLRGDNTFATVSQESTVINNNADNRMITGSGTANTLNGEANLTFDGTTLGLTGNQTVSGTLGVTGAITGTLATAAQTNITSVGALNAGSITSGFGAIDNGSSNITSTGVGSFGSLDISGDIDVDGTTNLDVVDIDGAVNMASTALVTGVLTANGGAVFNEGGDDVDFRVESDTVTHALFVDGANGNVGIGIAPTFGAGGSRQLLQLTNGASGGQIAMGNNASESENPRIFSDADNLGFATATTGGGVFQFYTAGTERMRIPVSDSRSVLAIGTTTVYTGIISTTATNSSLISMNSGGGSEIVLSHHDALSTSGLGAVSFNRGTAVLASIDGLCDGATGSGAIRFHTRPNGGSITERMKITSDGRVGINDTAPTRMLHLKALGTEDAEEATIMFENEVGTTGSIRQGDTNSNAMIFTENGSERMRIATSGNVGIGTSAFVDTSKVQIEGAKTVSSGIPRGQLNISDSTAVATGVGGSINFSGNYNGNSKTTYGSIEGFKDNGTAGHYGGALVFRTRTHGSDNVERMRINSSGYIYVNTGGAEPHGSQVGTRITGTQGQAFWKSANSGTSGYGHLIFYNDNGEVGQIYTSSSSTTYATSSDYRLKENVVTEWDATTRLKQLKPSRFNFIADANTTVDGFLAHEAQAVVPECVTGTKDAMTAEVLYVEGDELPEGKVVGDVKTASAPDYQGIDQSKLVPLLVKTIQELEARITALEGA
jgi:hypothetical protein